MVNIHRQTLDNPFMVGIPTLGSHGSAPVNNPSMPRSAKHGISDFIRHVEGTQREKG